MEWIAFFGNIFGGLIGGFFTFFGVKMTLDYQRKKNKLEEEKKKAKEEEDALAARPILEIESLSSSDATSCYNPTDLDVVFLEYNTNHLSGYNRDSLDEKNLCFMKLCLETIVVLK